jgi:beta-lactamase regulating signal transducer with metallopeptidase domain
MTSEILATIIRANLVGGLAILAVLALRIPMRRAFGPELAYGLWAIPPIAFVATLMPPPVTLDDPGADPFALARDHSTLALALWGVGLAAVVALFAHAQMRFLASARRGRAGPSVVGVINPRIVMPADPGAYSVEERELIRAHERQHITRADPRAAALATTFQALCWFNPLVHLAVHVMRLDQELACDAGVLRHRPHDRALYARTLLKTQLAAQALPFGCHWLARGPHPLEVRVAALRSTARFDRFAGSVLLGCGIVSAALMAWNAQPPGEKHPPPVVVFLEQQGHRAVSVMLIPAPPRDPKQP